MKGYKRIEWVKGKAERNEALDLLVYNLAAAQFLGLHRYREHEWSQLRGQVSQGSLFADSKPAAPEAAQPRDIPERPSVPRPAPAVSATGRRTSHSGYLSRRR
ncbi:hypothetical protein D9M68_505400 [compost metagenome]